ncbi:MAG TPA: DUF1236 domain-containing protein [Xanthobacteraceae bacterium]|jgi:hypothetical protein
MTALNNFAILFALLAGGGVGAWAARAMTTPPPVDASTADASYPLELMTNAKNPPEAHYVDYTLVFNLTSLGDTVTLSAAQRSAAWKDLSKHATNQDAAGFDATIGALVPDTVEIEPIPSDVTANNPSLKPYCFAMVDHKLVIVDPSNKVIAYVLTTISHQLGHPRPTTGEGSVGSAQTKRLILSSQMSPWWWFSSWNRTKQQKANFKTGALTTRHSPNAVSMR